MTVLLNHMSAIDRITWRWVGVIIPSCDKKEGAGVVESWMTFFPLCHFYFSVHLPLPLILRRVKSIGYWLMTSSVWLDLHDIVHTCTLAIGVFDETHVQASCYLYSLWYWVKCRLTRTAGQSAHAVLHWWGPNRPKHCCLQSVASHVWTIMWFPAVGQVHIAWWFNYSGFTHD